MARSPHQPDDAWARLKPFRDPVTGKIVPQNPPGEPRQINREVDSRAAKNRGDD